LIKNDFDANNGNLKTSTYGNGFSLNYEYDPYGRVITTKKGQVAAYQYLYDARGNLAQIIDDPAGARKITKYSYDVGDRLIKQSSSDGSAIQYSYDNMDRATTPTYTFAGQTKKTTFEYGADNRKAKTTLATNGTITRTYDTLNREYITDINATAGQEPTLRTQRNFISDPSSKKTTTLIDTYTNYNHNGASDIALSQYQYAYDDNGNIDKVTDKDGNVTKYTYDQLNQLIRVDDQKAGVSTTYSYDLGGNITDTESHDYTTGDLGYGYDKNDYVYGDGEWKDLLTNYNWQDITYDAIGNPLSYRKDSSDHVMSFTWKGHQLKTAVANGKNVSYTYNNDGIRTSKTVDGVTTNYFLDGSTIMAQQTGNDVMWFLYDSDGTRVGFTYNGTAYYYTKNAQSDVTGIVDGNNNTVVEYSYDAWGKLLSTTGSMADTIGKQNPFLYRGYYYDSESGLYLTATRYYDPVVGRFINADDTDILFIDQDNLIQHNLYAYCLNNPVNMVDYTGYMAEMVMVAAGSASFGPVGWIIGGAILLGVGIWAGVTVYKNHQAKQANTLSTAYSMLGFASTAATPPPPNKGGKGTQTSSKTLYNKGGKNGFRVDVENPGNRTGQIHLQKGSVKYYYNVAEKAFRIGSSNGQLAPKAIQELLSNADVVKAIAKGLTILGY